MLRRLGFVISTTVLSLAVTPLMAMAQAGAAASGGGSELMKAGLIAVGANVGVGLAALGCGLGQGRMAASVMDAIGRNPNSAGQLFLPMILGFAFMESLTLYALVIAFILVFKI